MSDKNVVALTYSDRTKAFDTLTELERADAADLLTVKAAVVLERDSEGRLTTIESEDNHWGAGTATGGLIGGAVGLIGGPIGLLFSTGVGALIGAGRDDHKEDEATSAVATFSRSIEPGKTVVLAEVHEHNESVVDEIATSLGGELTRRSVDEVKDEMDAAEDAEKRAAKEADKALKEKKKADKAAAKEAEKQPA